MIHRILVELDMEGGTPWDTAQAVAGALGVRWSPRRILSCRPAEKVVEPTAAEEYAAENPDDRVPCRSCSKLIGDVEYMDNDGLCYDCTDDSPTHRKGNT